MAFKPPHYDHLHPYLLVHVRCFVGPGGRIDHDAVSLVRSIYGGIGLATPREAVTRTGALAFMGPQPMAVAHGALADVFGVLADGHTWIQTSQDMGRMNVPREEFRRVLDKFDFHPAFMLVPTFEMARDFREAGATSKIMVTL